MKYSLSNCPNHVWGTKNLSELSSEMKHSSSNCLKYVRQTFTQLRTSWREVVSHQDRPFPRIETPLHYWTGAPITLFSSVFAAGRESTGCTPACSLSAMAACPGERRGKPNQRVLALMIILSPTTTCFCNLQRLCNRGKCSTSVCSEEKNLCFSKVIKYNCRSLEVEVMSI